MAFGQLSLLNVPGIVVHGNGLTGECWEQWFTPAHILGGWRARLLRREAEENTRAMMLASAAEHQEDADQVEVDPPAADIEAPLQTVPKAVLKAAVAGQMSLF